MKSEVKVSIVSKLIFLNVTTLLDFAEVYQQPSYTNLTFPILEILSGISFQTASCSEIIPTVPSDST